MSKRTIILIGGAPLSGKSTLASELAKQLHMPWVSTDDIRKWMQALVRKEDYPDLFYGDGMDAVAFYEKYKTAQKVFEMEKRQGLEVQKGITAMIDSFWWWDECIIEGIAITPAYVRQLQATHPDITVKAAFLVDKDRENIKTRLYARGLWGDADTYPDDIKPIQLEWVILDNRYYEQEAQKHDFPVHNIAELEGLKEELVVTSTRNAAL